MGVFWRQKRLDPSVTISGDLIEPFCAAGTVLQVTRNGFKPLGLTGHLGNVGLESLEILTGR
jgi:hypothetical protein